MKKNAMQHIFVPQKRQENLVQKQRSNKHSKKLAAHLFTFVCLEIAC